MRRKDREVTDPHRLTEIIRACDCCRLGIRDGDGAYVVPLNFGYKAEGKGVFYFHCAREGRKLTLLAQSPNVGFELDTHHELRRGSKGCDFTFLYSSVMGRGVVRTVTELAEKREALTLLLTQYGGDGDTITDAEAESVTVLRLDVSEMTGKEHL